MLAAAAVLQEGRVGAVMDIVPVEDAVTLLCLRECVADLGLANVERVKHRIAVLKVVAIQAVAAPIDFIEQVAIFVLVCVDDVLTVLTEVRIADLCGRLPHKLEELIEERTREVVVPAPCTPIPIVTVEAVLTEQIHLRLGWEDAQAVFGARSAIPEEVVLAPPCHPALRPRLRRERGWREWDLLSTNDRRNLIEKLQICIGDLELVASNSACSLNDREYDVLCITYYVLRIMGNIPREHYVP